MKRSAFLAVACAGCVTYISVDDPSGKAGLTGERVRAIPWSVNGRAGVSFAGLFWTDSDDRKALDDGFYMDVRYSYELGRHWGIEASAGYFHAKNNVTFTNPFPPFDEIEMDDLDCAPFRLTLTFGGESRRYLMRWFIGGGGGYFVYGQEEKTPTKPVKNEWATHVLLGLEIKPHTHLEFPISARVDFGYIWPGESKKEMILAGITLYFGF